VAVVSAAVEKRTSHEQSRSNSLEREYTDNIFRLYFKVGLSEGLARRLFDSGDPDD